MKVLVANLGSTSFKYRLFEMDDERQLARGGIERIGSAESRCMVEIGGTERELTAHVPDHAAAVRRCLDQLTEPGHGLPARRGGSGRHRLQGRSWRAHLGRPARNARVVGRHGGHEPGGAGAQPALHRGHAIVEREAAGNPAGGGLRNRLSRNHARSQSLLPGAVRMGREVSHQTLGLSRRQPSLHWHADRRDSRPRRSARDLLSLGRIQFACAPCEAARALPPRWA